MNVALALWTVMNMRERFLGRSGMVDAYVTADRTTAKPPGLSPVCGISDSRTDPQTDGVLFSMPNCVQTTTFGYMQAV